MSCYEFAVSQQLVSENQHLIADNIYLKEENNDLKNNVQSTEVVIKPSGWSAIVVIHGHVVCVAMVQVSLHHNHNSKSTVNHLLLTKVTC